MKKAVEMTLKELTRYMDYSILHPSFTDDLIVEQTKKGVELGVKCVCVNPLYIDLCLPYCKNTDTLLAPTIDFPFGTSSTESRIKQIEVLTKYPEIVEFDIVANYGKLRSGKYEEVYNDLKACSDYAHAHNLIIKVIFEVDTLSEEEIRKACQIAVSANVDFVKTSTGFLTGYEVHGATCEVISIMMEEVKGKCKVKGAGCIRDRKHYLELIDLGIDRMGVNYKSAPTILGLE
ncbi:MAG: deoxyribose-phosphate aldolase [Holdemanella sp.]|nr:deoxyribose-phosphate aldolase [Holdemanella sp.]